MTYNTNVWGIDVSHHQGSINWASVAKSGCKFAFIKATEGERSNDSLFDVNWKRAKLRAPEMIRGAYHYAHIENNPIKESNHFTSVIRANGGIKPGDLVALDVEDVDTRSRRIGAKATANWCLTWLDTTAKTLKLPKSRVFIYTGNWWWKPRTNNSLICTSYPLWLASYTDEPYKIANWPERIWQYTNARSVPGIGKCDANYYYGTLNGLRRRAGLPALNKSDIDTR